MWRRVWLLVAIAAGLALAPGTGAFSAATMDREVSVTVADDPSEGFVGIHDSGGQILLKYGSNATGNSDRTLLTLQNNLRSTVAYGASVTDDDSTPNLHRLWFKHSDAEQTSVGPGKTAELKAAVVCGPDSRETWDVQITVDGTGIEGTVNHEVTVVCDGNGNVTGSSA